MGDKPFKNCEYLVSLTGASGVIYGFRLMEELLRQGARVAIAVSESARQMLADELNYVMPQDPTQGVELLRGSFDCLPDQIELFDREYCRLCAENGRPLFERMAVCPATVGTIAAVRAGLSNSDVQMAAQWALRRCKRLVLCPRESPLSALDLQNMADLARLGARIVPASPSFVRQPTTIDQLVKSTVDSVIAVLREP